MEVLEEVRLPPRMGQPLVALVGLSVVPLVDGVLRGLQDTQRVWRLAAAAIFVFASGYSLSFGLNGPLSESRA